VRAPQITALDNRVALVGDSGLGFLPTAGIGASNAMRSAAALSYDLALADATTAPAAIARWSCRVYDLVKANQQSSRELAKVMLVRHKSAAHAVDLLMRHMPASTWTKSIQKSMEAPF